MAGGNARLTPDIWGTLDNVGHLDFAIAADGTYELTIDDQPAGGRTNHLQIADRAATYARRFTDR